MLIHGDKKSHALWSIANVEKLLLLKVNEVRAATIKYFINGKTVVMKSINRLYLIEPMKQTSEDIPPKFFDRKICQI